MRYQDRYPEPPLLDSAALARPRAAELLTLEYFEAEPSEMAEAVYTQHHVLLNLRDEPQRVENWRDGTLREFEYLKDEIILTPAGMRSGWRWHVRSKVIVITLEPDRSGCTGGTRPSGCSRCSGRRTWRSIRASMR